MDQNQVENPHTKQAKKQLVVSFILYVTAIGGSFLLTPTDADTIWKYATIAFFFCGLGVNIRGVMEGWSSYKKKEKDHLYKTIGLFGNAILLALILFVYISGRISM
ncbi:MAG: hypothetical protein P1U56_17015 [Saprospiraceae bacterium]|nr:hypothetical protein [Saprospiraceae bacterium]